VDFSADMLVHMPEDARAVLHDIETLRLPERFDAVTLTSNMVSGADEQASAFLRTARAHLIYEHDDGRVWTQRAAGMHARSDEALEALLHAAGFAAQRFLDEDEDWVLACAV